MIHISLSPNLERDDRKSAFFLLLAPWAWKRGKAEDRLANSLERYYGIKKPLLLNSGRAALFLLFKTLGLEKGDEVLVQAFTCNAVPNPVLWCGATPIYVDIDQKGYTMDPLDLERKITPRSRVVVVQHTFGMAAPMEQILRIARNHKLFVVEDCAHAIGSTWQDKKLGTFGDAMFLSFGRDKCISSVYGGALLIRDSVVARHAKDIGEKFSYPSSGWIAQQLAHPIATSFLRTTYNYGGKFFLYLFQRMHILSLAVSRKEKHGEMPAQFPRRMPNALAILALCQFQKIDRFNEHRRELAAFYAQHLPVPFRAFDQKAFGEFEKNTVFLRYPASHAKRDEILRAAKKESMILGNWYSCVIDPPDTNFEALLYRAGSCPNAEIRAQESFNLPTDIRTSLEDAGRIVGFLEALHEQVI